MSLSEFDGQRLERRAAAGGQDQIPACGRIDPRQGGADAGRSSGDEHGARGWAHAGIAARSGSTMPARAGGSVARRSAMVMRDRASPAAVLAAIRALPT